MTSLSQDAISGRPLATDSASESVLSAVTWPAVAAGGIVAASTSLILVALGSGLGLAASSPWPGSGPSFGAFTVMAGVWLIVTQWAASGVGGYVTGRLRTRWTGTHTHEVFFRDTAHGFLTWSLATILVAVLVLGAGFLAVGTGAAVEAPMTYEADVLLRSPHAGGVASSNVTRAEVARILARSVSQSAIGPSDRAYLSSVVSVQTGLSAADAANRVDASIAEVRKNADALRKSASATSVFTALAMLVGAFIASVAAAIGGQQRDEHL